MIILKCNKESKYSASAKEITLDILLKEYASLRAESANCDNTQMHIATIAFTFLAASFTITSSFSEEPASSFLAYCAFPCISMFFCLLWMDQIYRRIRFGTYLRRTENKVYSLIQNDETAPFRIMEFEHWISRLDEKKCLLLRPRYMYGCIMCGACLVFPILIPISRKLLFSDSISAWCFYKNNSTLAFAMLFIAIVYYIYLILLIFRIASLPHEATLMRITRS